MTTKASRIVLALPMDDAVLGAALRRELPVQVAWETPYFNRTVLAKVQSLSPDIVIVSEALPGDGDLSLVAFVRGLRQHNIRVIFLADTSHPGDPMLSDLVAMNVTDILLEGEVDLTKLSYMLEQQTPWSQVAHLLRPGSSRRLPEATAPPEPKETVREVVVERVVTVEKLVTVPAPGRSQRLLTVIGLGPEGAGVTTVAINLAAVLAANGRKVALLDGDTRWPTVSVNLNLPVDHDGVSQLLCRQEPNRAGVEAHGLTVFGTPMFPAKPATASLAEPALMQMIDRLRAHDDVVIDAGYTVDHLFTRAAIQAADEVLLVCDLDLHRALVGAHLFAQITALTDAKKCRLVVNRVDPCLKTAKADEILEGFGGELTLAGTLPLEASAPDAQWSGCPLVNYLPTDSPFRTAVQRVAGLQDPLPKRKGWWRR